MEHLNKSTWGQGHYSTGEKRDNVTTQHRNTKNGEFPDLEFLFHRIKTTAVHVADIMAINIDPELHYSVLFSRWEPGNHFNTHTDYDATQINTEYSRKLNFYCSLSDDGGMALDRIGRVVCDQGDALITSALMPHSVPVQEKVTRYSMISWILGPRWQ